MESAPARSAARLAASSETLGYSYGERKTYENVYFHTFHMQDGKIRHYYEYSNAKLLFDVLGVELPAIQTPAGWPGVV